MPGAAGVVPALVLILGLAFVGPHAAVWRQECACGGVAGLVAGFWPHVAIAVVLCLVPSVAAGVSTTRLAISCVVVGTAMALLWSSARATANPLPLRAVPERIVVAGRSADLTARIRLFNASPRDVVVRETIASCGCVRADGVKDTTVPAGGDR